MKKNLIALVFLLAGILSFLPLKGSGSGKLNIVLRPAYTNISSDTSQGAVLVTLSGYPGNDVRYRLFNGSSQYACWSSISGSFVTSSAYSAGPLVPGSPSVTSSFWIVYQRGTNKSAAASYRDRTGPEYSSNNNTASLPAAAEIRDSFIISGRVLFSEINDLAKKYLLLAWSGNTLVSAGSSDLVSGNFSILIPEGTKIDKIEARTLDNLSIASVNGSWSEFTKLPAIQLLDNPAQDSKLREIKVDGVDLAGFEPDRLFYEYELSSGSMTVPVLDLTLNNPGQSAIITSAADLNGDINQRTTRIEVSSPGGYCTRIYFILFNPVMEISSISELKTGDTSRIYHIKSPLKISYQNQFRNQKYVQDSVGAILIDDPGAVITSIYKIGDAISNLKCKLKIDSGIIGLIPRSDPGNPISSDNEIIPEISTIDQINSDTGRYDSRLVRIRRITPFDPGARIISGASYSLSDGKNPVLLSVRYPDLDYIGTLLPGLCDISGIVSISKGTIRITPRFTSDIYVYNNDAALSDLSLNGQTLPGFDPEVSDYSLVLPSGTDIIPLIEYSQSDPLASVLISAATNLNGSAGERTASLTVTAEDGQTRRIYTICFILEDNTGTPTLLPACIRVFPVPAKDILNIVGSGEPTRLEIHDISGNVVSKISEFSTLYTLDLSNLDPGFYFIKIRNYSLKFLKQ